MTFSLEAAREYRTEIVNLDDVAKLRTIAAGLKGESSPMVNDADLYRATNIKLCESVILATTIDNFDRIYLDEQNEFKDAYDNLIRTIDNITNDDLRNSVKLPEEYSYSIENNQLLQFANKSEPGRPADWRRAEFWVTLLHLYRLYSGNPPGKTEDGPTTRFMRQIGKILNSRLKDVTDKKTADFVSVRNLWIIPSSPSFLKDWLRAKEESGINILHRVEVMTELEGALPNFIPPAHDLPAHERATAGFLLRIGAGSWRGEIQDRGDIFLP